MKTYKDQVNEKPITLSLNSITSSRNKYRNFVALINVLNLNSLRQCSGLKFFGC